MAHPLPALSLARPWTSSLRFFSRQLQHIRGSTSCRSSLHSLGTRSPSRPLQTIPLETARTPLLFPSRTLSSPPVLSLARSLLSSSAPVLVGPSPPRRAITSSISFTPPAFQGHSRATAASVRSRSRGMSSVAEARHKIFGWALLGPEDKGMRFKSLKRLKRRGLIGPKVTSYFPEPDPMWKHPVIRRALNEEREEKLALLRKLGKSAPKKGAGKKKK